MEFPSKLIENAVGELARLPGIGRKTALRLALHLLKAEMDTVLFDTRETARRALFDYIEGFYNPTRRHSSIGYMSPSEYELAIAEEVRVA